MLVRPRNTEKTSTVLGKSGSAETGDGTELESKAPAPGHGHNGAGAFISSRKIAIVRFEKFGLTLHPEKTRLVEFGRNAAKNAKRQGKKPATFDFLGLTHICARSRTGRFTVHVKTIGKRLRRGLNAIAEWCRQHRHEPVGEEQKTLNAKLPGHYQYYGRPTNYRSIRQFYRRVLRIWKEWLSRRRRHG